MKYKDFEFTQQQIADMTFAADDAALEGDINKALALHAYLPLAENLNYYLRIGSFVGKEEDYRKAYYIARDGFISSYEAKNGFLTDIRHDTTVSLHVEHKLLTDLSRILTYAYRIGQLAYSYINGLDIENARKYDTLQAKLINELAADKLGEIDFYCKENNKPEILGIMRDMMMPLFFYSEKHRNPEELQAHRQTVLNLAGRLVDILNLEIK